MRSRPIFENLSRASPDASEIFLLITLLNLPFLQIKNWVRELQEVLKDSAALFVVGNKIDLEGTRTISKEIALQYAESVGASYHECSAKENVNIDSLFENIAKAMVEQEKNVATLNLNRRSSLRRSNSRRTLQIIDDEEVARPRKKCC